MKAFFRIYILPHITLFILRLLWWSWRVKLEEPPEMSEYIKIRKPFLLAHWHGDEVVLLPLVKRYRLATMTSTSKDGDLMAWIVSQLGGTSSRGSSTRGGVNALRGLIRLIKINKHNSSVAVDGPRGPIYKVKPGIFEISRLTGTPIFWVGVSATKYHLFNKAWNKAILPLPFSKVYIQWHGPMKEISPLQDPKAESLALDLENKLNAAKHQAQSLLSMKS